MRIRKNKICNARKRKGGNGVCGKGMMVKSRNGKGRARKNVTEKLGHGKSKMEGEDGKDLLRWRKVQKGDRVERSGDEKRREVEIGPKTWLHNNRRRK